MSGLLQAYQSCQQGNSVTSGTSACALRQALYLHRLGCASGTARACKAAMAARPALHPVLLALLLAPLLARAGARSAAAPADRSNSNSAVTHGPAPGSASAGLWCTACVLAGAEPLEGRDPSCGACAGACGSACGAECAPGHGLQADGGEAGGKEADSGPAWQPLVIMGVGEMLGNIVRGVTGAAGLGLLAASWAAW